MAEMSIGRRPMTSEEIRAHFGNVQANPRPVAFPPDARTYLMAEPGSGLVKIGASSNLTQRLKDLRQKTHKQLIILWDHEGGFDLERALHRVFDTRRVTGEWFSFPDGYVVERVNEAITRGLTPPGGPAFEIGEIVRPIGWPILTCRGHVVEYAEPHSREPELRYVVDMISGNGKRIRDRGRHVLREHQVRRAA